MHSLASSRPCERNNRARCAQQDSCARPAVRSPSLFHVRLRTLLHARAESPVRNCGTHTSPEPLAPGVRCACSGEARRAQPAVCACVRALHVYAARAHHASLWWPRPGAQLGPRFGPRIDDQDLAIGGARRPTGSAPRPARRLRTPTSRACGPRGYTLTWARVTAFVPLVRVMSAVRGACVPACSALPACTHASACAGSAWRNTAERVVAMVLCSAGCVHRTARVLHFHPQRFVACLFARQRVHTRTEGSPQHAVRATRLRSMPQLRAFHPPRRRAPCAARGAALPLEPCRLRAARAPAPPPHPDRPGARTACCRRATRRSLQLIARLRAQPRPSSTPASGTCVVTRGRREAATSSSRPSSVAAIVERRVRRGVAGTGPYLAGARHAPGRDRRPGRAGARRLFPWPGA